MSGERSEAGWLEWLALLGPLAVTFLGAVAIFVAQRSRDGHQLVIGSLCWFRQSFCRWRYCCPSGCAG